MKSLSRVRLFTTLWTVAHQAPLSMEFSQARILEWVAIFFSRGIFLTQGLNPYLLHLLHWQVDSLLLSHLGRPWHAGGSSGVCVSAQSCPTLCDPVNCSPQGFSVHRIFRQEYWSGRPFPLPGDLPDPEIEPASLAPPALAGGFFTTSTPWEAL